LPRSDSASGELAPSQRRLQRLPDFTGSRLNRFSQVFLRHGLPGALLGAVCLFVPEMRALLGEALAGLLAAPARYLVAALMIFGAILGYAWFLDRRIDAPAVGWLVYLLAVSMWEEWVFRLAIPYFGQAQGFDLRTVVIVSNVLFGVLHYFTLRWKWQWCLGAFLGGLALSRNLHEDFDLALVIGIHWIATYLNTPRLPGRSSRREQVEV
jgi:hypothetical protein